MHGFKQPSIEEAAHDFLWRIHRACPRRGQVAVFNRSHYEEVLVVRVHDLVKYQKIPDMFNNKKIWKQRYEQINYFEKYLYENGIIIIKFFLHVSKEEQKKRFLKRIEDPSKNWKFSIGDIEERKYWNDYQKAYQEAISATSKRIAPWYVIPADKKWFMRLAVSEILVKEMKKLKPEYPELQKEQLSKLAEARKYLMNNSELKERDE